MSTVEEIRASIQLVDGEMRATIEQELPPLPGFCTPKKGARLAELVLAEGARECVELGVFGGRSLIPVALALRAAGRGRAYGFDPYSAQAALEGSNRTIDDDWWSKVDYEGTLRKAEMAIGRLGLRAHAWIIRERSVAASAMFKPSSVDLLHQDSNHSGEVSSAEVLFWAPKMKPGALWVLDDAHWESTKRAQTLLAQHRFSLVEEHVEREDGMDKIWRVFRSPKD